MDMIEVQCVIDTVTVITNFMTERKNTGLYTDFVSSSVSSDRLWDNTYCCHQDSPKMIRTKNASEIQRAYFGSIPFTFPLLS